MSNHHKRKLEKLLGMGLPELTWEIFPEVPDGIMASHGDYFLSVRQINKEKYCKPEKVEWAITYCPLFEPVGRGITKTVRGAQIKAKQRLQEILNAQ